MWKFKPSLTRRFHTRAAYASSTAELDSSLAAHFRRVLDPNSVFSWNAIIADLARDGHPTESLRAFRSMLARSLRPDRSSFPCAIKSCAALRELRSGRQLHLRAFVSGLQPDLFVSSSLVDMYSKCGQLHDARRAFEETPGKNAVSWTSMIVGYVYNEESFSAIHLFKEFMAGVSREGCDSIDRVVAVAAVSACTRIADKGATGTMHGLFLKMGFGTDVSVANTLIDAYAKCGDMQGAGTVFDGIEERDTVSWNTMVAVYAQNGHSVEALSLYVKMVGTGSASRDAVTFSSVMLACAHAGALQFGKCIHNQVIKMGLEEHVHVGTSVVDMYGKCGRVILARRAFNRMTDKNVKSWTAMAAGYGMHGYAQGTLEVFYEMIRSGIRPNYITFVAVLTACSHAGLVNEGRSLFKRMTTEFNIEPGLEHYGCLVDLLGRAGHISEAYEMIKGMKASPDGVIWATLLSACRTHKNIELGEISARKLFELDPKNCGYYVTLSSIYADTGRWYDAERLRVMIKNRSLLKPPGYSMVELKGRTHIFMIGDKNHPQNEKIYKYLDALNTKMLLIGYTPDTASVLHDIDQEEKETVLRVHSEKLAAVFAIINTAHGTSIQVVKNLRICGDCHTTMKFISKIESREIIIRDSHRFHHFNEGLCSCRDYW